MPSAQHRAPRTGASHAIWLVALFLLASLFAERNAVSQPIDPNTVLSNLPGFRSAALKNWFPPNTALPASGLSATAGSGSVYLFQANGAWTGAYALNNPSSFAIPGLDASHANVTVTTFAVIASSQAGTVALSSLPAALQSSFSGFAGAAQLPLAQGINFFVSGSAPTGPVASVMKAVGMPAGNVTLTGSVGAGVFVKLLSAAGLKPSSDADDSVNLTISFPGGPTGFVPAPFNALSAADQGRFNLQLQSPTLTVAKPQGSSTWTIAGSMTANVTVFGATQTVQTSMSFDGTTFTVDGLASFAHYIKPFAIVSSSLPELRIYKAGLHAAVTSQGSTFSLTADAEIDAAKGEVTFTVLTDGQYHLSEVSAALNGSIALPRAILPPNSDPVTITNPTVGIMFGQSAMFIGGDVTWRGLTTKAVLYGQQGGGAVFLKLQGNPKLSQVLGTSVPAAMDMAIPKTVLVLSSVPIADLPLSQLPSAAQSMITSIGKKTGDHVQVVQGLTLFTAFQPSDWPAGLKDSFGGSNAPLILAGSVGVGDGGGLSLELYADIPSFTMPAKLQSYGFVGARGRMFLGVSSGPTEVRLGLALDLTFRDHGQPITFDGRLYAVAGDAGASLNVAAKLSSDWNDPFGLTGITLKAPVGFRFAVSTDGSASILLDAGAKFNAEAPSACTKPNQCVDLRLGGAVGVLFSTGVPALKTIGLLASFDKVGLLTPVTIGQTVLRGAANVATNLVVATQHGFGTTKLSTQVLGALAIARTQDIVGAVGATVPSSGVAKDLADVELRDVKLFLATPGVNAGPEFPDLDDVGLEVKGTLYVKGSEIVAVDDYLTTKKGFRLFMKPGASVANVKMGPVTMQTPSVDAAVPIPGLSASAAPHFIFSGGATIGGVTLAETAINLSSSEIAVSAGAGYGTCAPMPTVLVRPGASVYLGAGPGGALLEGAGKTTLSRPFTTMADVPPTETAARWTVLDAGNGNVAFQNDAGNLWLQIQNGQVTGIPSVGLPANDVASATFRVVGAGQGIALYNAATNTYLSLAGKSPTAQSLPAVVYVHELSYNSAISGPGYLKGGFPSPCGTWGVSAAISGKILSSTNLSLAGNGRFDPPPDFAVVGSASAGFSLSSQTGAQFSFVKQWDSARFTMTGSFTNQQTWSLSGSASGIPNVTADVYDGKTKIATVNAHVNNLSFTVSNSGASLHAKASGNYSVLGGPSQAWSFDDNIGADHVINDGIPRPDVFTKQTYVNGPALGWVFKGDCEKNNSQGCSQWGATWYGNCKSPYSGSGPVCAIPCPPHYTDVTGTCTGTKKVPFSFNAFP